MEAVRCLVNAHGVLKQTNKVWSFNFTILIKSIKQTQRRQESQCYIKIKFKKSMSALELINQNKSSTEFNSFQHLKMI